ncbi:MAG: acetyltransferase [Mycobacteriaceae bacterium]
MRALIVLGAGGLARETAELAAATGRWRVGEVLDDDPAQHGRAVGGAHVSGGSARLAELLATDPDSRLVLCLGSPRRPALRLQVARRLGVPDQRYATLVHPAATVGGARSIGAGSVLLAGVVATADVVVGAHCVLMPGVVLTHDDELDDGVTLAAGVRLAGGVRVGEGAYLGSGALVREGVVIGAGAVVGMGAVVLGDVPPAEVWVGQPARRLRDTGS